jgi:type IV secretory pathway VirB6-like protein
MPRALSSLNGITFSQKGMKIRPVLRRRPEGLDSIGYKNWHKSCICLCPEISRKVKFIPEKKVVKRMKKVIALVISMLFAFAVSSVSFAADTTKTDNANGTKMGEKAETSKEGTAEKKTEKKKVTKKHKKTAKKHKKTKKTEKKEEKGAETPAETPAQ